MLVAGVMSSRVCFGTLALLALGCAPHPLDESETLVESITTTVCDCADLMGFEDQRCRASFSHPKGELLDCVKDAYDRYPDLHPQLLCHRDAYREYHACIEAVGGCDDDAFQDCRRQFRETFMTCPIALGEGGHAWVECLGAF